MVPGAFDDMVAGNGRRSRRKDGFVRHGETDSGG